MSRMRVTTSLDQAREEPSSFREVLSRLCTSLIKSPIRHCFKAASRKRRECCLAYAYVEGGARLPNLRHQLSNSLFRNSRHSHRSANRIIRSSMAYTSNFQSQSSRIGGTA